MNDFLLIFMGIFILLLIFLIFILLAYVYHTYTTYTVDINKNLETSEDAINNTSTAFNKLQDSVINELAKVNKNQETIITTLPDNLISLNSNLLNIFEISSNNNKITDITKTKIDYDSLGVLKPFTSYKNFTTITDATNNFLTICNNKTDPSKKACIRMNIDDSDMFNIYTSNINRNSSNVLGINIYDSNNGVLASFDAFNRKILLGSGSSETAAISINNNVYTPNVIVCKCTYYNTDGTPGPIGFTGAKGDKGDTGAKGDKGDKGDTGAKGDKGDTGSTGSTGATGPADAAGPAGDAGAAGAAGPAGAAATFRNKYEKFSIQSAKIKLQFISNYPIKKDAFINFPIINNFIIPASQIGNPIYGSNKILKFQVVESNGILANTIITKEFNINLITIDPNNNTSMIETTTTGYITAT